MATSYRSGIGVQTWDILEASQKIQSSVVQGLSLESSSTVNSNHIGSRLNEWRRPVAEYGRNNSEWEVKIKSSPFVGDIEFESRKEWADARKVVDTVLELMLKEIKIIAHTRFDGIKIERYVRQGSSRDGLKVIAPDEFDTLLQFHIEEMSYTVVNELRNGKIIPEFCRLEIAQSISQLEKRLPKLFKVGAFYQHGDKVWLNASMFYQGVFESTIDSATRNILKKIQETENAGNNVSFHLIRSTNPPSINVAIHLDDHKQIDVDIVPGLQIRNDQVPDPMRKGYTMDCPVYAVIKRVNASDVPVPDIVWRICSSGYEKHTLDLAQFDQRQRYIVTALRIMKTYFARTKSMAKANNQPPPQITTVLRSYFLKHVGFYLILYLCYIHTDVSIDGVQEALLYFISFLSAVLEKRCLPHFFHSNQLIRRIYPDYPVRSNHLRFNLLRNKSADALNQAKLSLDNHLITSMGFAMCGAPETYSYRKRSEIQSSFMQEITSGEFF